MTTLTDLPPEILEYILGHIDFPGLGNVRLVWPSLDSFVLPHLFCVIRLSFLEKHRRQFLGISSSPHLARHVQQLRWFSLYHVDDPDDFSKSYLSKLLSNGSAKEFRAQFFEGLDAMPNLKTFITTILQRTNLSGPLWLATQVSSYDGLKRPRRYYGFIEGLTHFLGPAMCRPQSRIKSLRCCDHGIILQGFPMNYRTKWPRQSLAGPVNIKIDLCKFESELAKHFRSLVPEFDHSATSWQDALESLDEIDLCTAFAFADPEEFQRQTLQPMCWSFLRAAKNLQILSLHSLQGRIPDPQDSHYLWTFEKLFDLRWDNLETLKLVNLTLSTKEFNNVDLHLILGGGTARDSQAQIIAEQEILDFINSKDPTKDPFLNREPIGYDEWHVILRRPSNGNEIDYYANTWATAVQYPEELSQEWPRWKTLEYTCKPCRKK
ncbi:hypothetical protein FSARC_10706 [Fusarium sarcochroum]|uniref:F-box domain-containing protein n=1 Tax=Fusarium sarcochroum TaxID=1208366 RepID=A0A8H4TKG3_9HYPO|nr:hypothetical protein FSARC_10706 [Fusarium sarcochroum]